MNISSANPILKFREINHYSISHYDEQRSFLRNAGNKSLCKTLVEDDDMLITSTLITETREAVDSSEHSY